MIKKESIIALSDNNEYVVVEIMEYKNKKYLYLVDINNHENYMFAELEEDKINEVTEKELLEILIRIAIRKSNIDENI